MVSWNAPHSFGRRAVRPPHHAVRRFRQGIYILGIAAAKHDISRHRELLIEHHSTCAVGIGARRHWYAPGIGPRLGIGPRGRHPAMTIDRARRVSWRALFQYGNAEETAYSFGHRGVPRPRRHFPDTWFSSSSASTPSAQHGPHQQRAARDQTTVVCYCLFRVSSPTSSPEGALVCTQSHSVLMGATVRRCRHAIPSCG